MLHEYHVTPKQLNEDFTDEQLLIILIKRRERITGVRPSKKPKSKWTIDDLRAAHGLKQ